MIIVWVLYSFVAFAPGGNITGIYKTLDDDYTSKIECEAAAKEDLARLIARYPEATHIQTACFPDAGSHKLGWR